MKKFGKVIIATVIVGAVAAAVAYFYTQRKKQSITIDEFEDDEDEDEDRSYVSLNSVKEAASNVAEKAGEAFTPLKDAVKDPQAR